MDRRGCLGLGGVVSAALDLDAVGSDAVFPAVSGLGSADLVSAVPAVSVPGLGVADLGAVVLAAVGRGPMVVDLSAVAAGRGPAENVLLPKLSVHPFPKQCLPLAVFPPALDSLDLPKSSHLLPELPPQS